MTTKPAQPDETDPTPMYRKLIDHPDFEIPVPSRESVVGFLVVLLIAAAMLAGLVAVVAWIRA